MLKRFSVVLWLALFCATAQASSDPRAYAKDIGGVLTAVAANAAAGTRTFTLSSDQLIGYKHFIFYVAFTYAAATNVRLTCTVSNDGNTTDFIPQTCVTAAGVCTLNDGGIFDKAISAADKKYAFRMDILGYRDLECVYSTTSGGASDLITVEGALTSN